MGFYTLPQKNIDIGQKKKKKEQRERVRRNDNDFLIVLSE